MRRNFTLNIDEYSENARRVHHELMHATELQLHRAVDHAIENYRKNRNSEPSLTLNLLPALRIRYGNLLNEQLLTATIVLTNPEEVTHGQISRTEFSQAGPADMAFFFTVAGINDSEPMRWDTRDHGPTLPPSLDVNDLIEFIEILADANFMQESVLFTGHAQSLLTSQAKSKEELDQLEWDITNLQRKAEFYEAAFNTVVEAHRKPTLDLIYKALKSTYRLQSAHGVGSENATTYWLELGEIADEGSNHILGNTAQSEIEGDVRAALKALPQAEQLALWQENDAISDWFSGDYERALGAKLSDDSDYLDEIVRKVCRWLMGSAIDDWHKAEAS